MAIHGYYQSSSQWKRPKDKLVKLDVFDENICLPVLSVKLTTATKAFLSSEGILASGKSNF